MSVPTTLQCGHEVSLSRSANADHSCSSRKNHRWSPTFRQAPGNSERTATPGQQKRAGSDKHQETEEAKPSTRNNHHNRSQPLPNSPCKTPWQMRQEFGKIRRKVRSECGKGQLNREPV